jgi:hypothetical protein
MPTLQSIFDALKIEHRIALEWFHIRQGQEISWPEPLPDGTFLVNRAKGIHKPEGWTYALSIRQSLNTEYKDEDVDFREDGSWSYRYSQEGQDQNYFTNKSLLACITDQIPVGVIRQSKLKPNPLYKVLGVALVTELKDGLFTLKGFPPNANLSTSEASSPTYQQISEFKPHDINDARQWIETAIVRRQGQGRFRAELLDAYGGKCAITGFEVTATLEAAHIVPYRGKETNIAQNGLLLRADIHTLFDLGLLSINEKTMTVIISPVLYKSSYAALQGAFIHLPTDKAKHPSKNAIAEHRKRCCF